MMHHRLTAKALLLLSTWSIATTSEAQNCPQASHGSKALAMLSSIVARKQGVMSSGQATSTLESGILAQAILNALVVYPCERTVYESFLEEVLDTVSQTVANSTGIDIPLDRFSVGTALYDYGNSLYSKSSRNTAIQKQAFEVIEQSLWSQPRNKVGGFWYYVYPNWSYLDGMVSLLPFLDLNGHSISTHMKLEMVHQMDLLLEHCKHESGLLVHGYDSSRKAVWADKNTGGSPYVWSRSLGWFLLGTTQTYERLGCHDPDAEWRSHDLCRDLREPTVSLITNLVKYADKHTGVWYQLTTLGDRSGNYLESSGTALFITAMLRAARLGMFQRDGKTSQMIQDAAKRAYDYVVKNFVTDTGNGTIGYDKTVSTCSLNSTATFEYYTTRPILENSLVGESAFVLASLEMER